MVNFDVEFVGLEEWLLFGEDGVCNFEYVDVDFGVGF